MTYTIAAFYHFVPLAAPDALRLSLKQELAALDVCGSLLVAHEGINGTLAGTAENINTTLGLLNQQCGLPLDKVKFSSAHAKPFNKLKVRLKKEIITFRQPQANPHEQVGQYVTAQDWNALLQKPDMLVLDTRNSYETRIGTFAGAVVPPIDHFTDFAAFVRSELAAMKDRPVAMFCTGGIRCEKASAFMLAEGFKNVYHLEGGILKYLEQVPESQSLWQGDCYVFDKRMAVGHGLKPSAYGMCFSCGNPLTENDRMHAQYEEGVSCHHCFAATSADDKARFRMRHSQMMAADGQV